MPAAPPFNPQSPQDVSAASAYVATRLESAGGPKLAEREKGGGLLNPASGVVYQVVPAEAQHGTYVVSAPAEWATWFAVLDALENEAHFIPSDAVRSLPRDQFGMIHLNKSMVRAKLAKKSVALAPDVKSDPESAYLFFRADRLKQPEKFVHLHNHSVFSLLDGASSIEGMVRAAYLAGQPAMALTDHGAMFASWKFYVACREWGIKPILGVEAYLVEDTSKKYLDSQGNPRRFEHHITLLAMNEQGWQRLCQLISEAGEHHFYYQPRIGMKQLCRNNDGIYCLTGCFRGPVAHYLQRREAPEGEELHWWNRYNPDKAREYLRALKSSFKDRLGGEVQSNDFEQYMKAMPEIVQMLQDEGVDQVVTNDCLPTGTSILTKRGPVPVEQVVIDDQVWTHRNRWARVYAVNARAATALCEFDTRLGGRITLQCTPNHKVMVHRGDHTSWLPAGDVVPGDYFVIPKVSPCALFTEVEPTHIDLLSVVTLIDDHRAVRHDGSTDCLVSNHSMGVSTISIPRMLPITDDLLWVLGRHVADGYVESDGGSQIGCAFHENETGPMLRYRSYFESLGMKVSLGKVSEHGVRLYLSSVVFGQLLTVMCGSGAMNKHLPVLPGRGSVFGSWSSRQMSIMMESYFDGDGHDRDGKAGVDSVATVSARLAWELHAVLNAWGFPVLPRMERHTGKKHINPKADPSKWNPLFVLSFGGKKAKAIHARVGGKHVVIPPIKCECLDLGDSWGVRVQRCRRVSGKFDVFNFSVRKDESYVAGGFIVHNCHYERAEDALLQGLLSKVGGAVKDGLGDKVVEQRMGGKKVEGPYFVRERHQIKYDLFTPDMYDRTCEIADRCNLQIPIPGDKDYKYLFPKYPIEQDVDWAAFQEHEACCAKP